MNLGPLTQLYVLKFKKANPAMSFYEFKEHKLTLLIIQRTIDGSLLLRSFFSDHYPHILRTPIAR
mgnify:CR=1 FL=1